MNNSLPYRPNVCLLIMNRENKLFLGERSGSEEVWQLPQGGIDNNEKEETSALREAAEELGADVDFFRVVKKFEATHQYDFRNPPDYAIDKWRGQSQTFWLLEFLGADTDIDLARFEQEFSSFCWCTAEEVRSKAESLRLPGYLKPLEEFELFLQSQ